jgi:hypothetical protein
VGALPAGRHAEPDTGSLYVAVGSTYARGVTHAVEHAVAL